MHLKIRRKKNEIQVLGRKSGQKEEADNFVGQIVGIGSGDYGR
jgi:hypothetical protein